MNMLKLELVVLSLNTNSLMSTWLLAFLATKLLVLAALVDGK